MKKVLGVLLTVFMLLIINIDVYADSSETDLHININGIKERDYKVVALTDAYDINILTKESRNAQNVFKIVQKQKTDELCNQLQLNNTGFETDNNDQYMQTADFKIFIKPCNYENGNVTNINESNYTFVLEIVIFIILAIISFLLALVIQRMKRRKNNVYNSYYRNGK